MKIKTIVVTVALIGITTSAFGAGQWSQKRIPVQVNPNLKILVDGKPLQSDVEPFIIKGRVMVPVRAVAETMGGLVSWDQNNSQVKIVSGKKDNMGKENHSPVAGTRVIPHTLNADGKEVLESKMVSTDYASLILAMSWVAKNASSKDKNFTTNQLVTIIQDTQKLFINPDGSVKAQYDNENGVYELQGDVEIKNQAQMAYSLVYSHHSAMEGNYDSAVFASVHKDTARLPIQIAAYSLKNLADAKNGGFYQDLKKEKKDLADQAYGLYAIQPLVWLWQKHPDRLSQSGYNEAQLREYAIKTDDFLKKIWSAEHNIYASSFNTDGSAANFVEAKYDLRTIGYLLWGHSLLHNLLKDVEPQRAADIEVRAQKFFNKVIVEGVTYRKDAGIPREIKVINGVVGVSRDETNTGRLFDFVHAVFQYQRTIKDPRALEIARDLVVLGADKMHTDGVLIHDFVFSEPSQKSPIREVPYLGAYITAAERLFDKLTPEEQVKVRRSIQSNYDFILDKAIR